MTERRGKGRAGEVTFMVCCKPLQVEVSLKDFCSELAGD